MIWFGWQWRLLGMTTKSLLVSTLAWEQQLQIHRFSSLVKLINWEVYVWHTLMTCHIQVYWTIGLLDYTALCKTIRKKFRCKHSLWDNILFAGLETAAGIDWIILHQNTKQIYQEASLYTTRDKLYNFLIFIIQAFMDSTIEAWYSVQCSVLQQKTEKQFFKNAKQFVKPV